MKTPHDLKVEFLTYVNRLREDAQSELDLFGSGTVVMRRNGENITAELVEQVKATIARLDDLISKLNETSVPNDSRHSVSRNRS
jgi:hypothetical protein